MFETGGRRLQVAAALQKVYWWQADVHSNTMQNPWDVLLTSAPYCMVVQEPRRCPLVSLAEVWDVANYGRPGDKFTGHKLV